MTASQNSALRTNPTAQVSWGELIDKMTILQIKEQRLSSAKAVANVRRELDELKRVSEGVTTGNAKLSRLAGELQAVNETLWEIEDKIRAKEAEQLFDQEFIDLARSVYFQNDKRGDVKRRINMLLKSDLIEEKQYTAYAR